MKTTLLTLALLLSSLTAKAQLPEPYPVIALTSAGAFPFPNLGAAETASASLPQMPCAGVFCTAWHYTLFFFVLPDGSIVPVIQSRGFAGGGR